MAVLSCNLPFSLPINDILSHLPTHESHARFLSFGLQKKPCRLCRDKSLPRHSLLRPIHDAKFRPHGRLGIGCVCHVEGAASTCQKFLQILFLYLFRLYKRKLTCLGQVGPPGYDQPCKWEIVVPCRTCPARNPCSCFTSCCRPLQIITNQCHSLNPVLLFQFFWKSPLFI